MSFVVRNKQTGRYLCGHDDWTPEERDALQFSSGLKLVDFVEHDAHVKQDAIEVLILPGLATDAPRASA
jgi:hypothetical protein